MAQSQSDTEKCCICLNAFQQPKQLDCKHSFCLICLQNFIHKTAENNQFRCPLCRTDMTIPSHGIHNFPDKPNSDNSTTSDVPQCDVCEDISSRFRCVDCEQYLCKSCKTMHDKLKTCKDHVVVRLEETTDQTSASRGGNSEKQREKSGISVTDICSNHRDKSVDVFCKQCNMAICYKCLVSDHDGHNFSELQDEKTRQEARYELTNLNTAIQKHIKTLEDFSASLNVKYSEITDSVKIACNKVDAQVAKICLEVERLGEKVKEDLKKACGEEAASSDGEEYITKLMKDIELLTEELKASVKYTVNVLADNSIVQALNRLPKVRQQQKEFSSRKLEIQIGPIISFKESNIDTDILSKQLGSIEKANKNTCIYKQSFNVRSEFTGIYEHSFDVNSVPPTGQWVWSPEFVYLGGKWKVVVCRGGHGMLYTRLSGEGRYKYTVKLVNHGDDHQSVIQQASSDIFDVNMIDWGRLCDPENGFLINNTFTIQVTDIKILLL